MPESNNFSSFIKNKMEEVPFTTLFLFLFGAILVVIGIAETIKVFESSISIKDEFRWLISGMGFIFILAGIVLAFSREKPSGQSKNDKPAPIGNSLPPFYTFHAGTQEELRHDSVFQDFEMDRNGGNRNSVHYFWADASMHNTIQASIETSNTNDDKHFLHVNFKNTEETEWFSNVSIMPISEQALNNKSDTNTSKLKYRYLKISARVQKESFLHEVGVAVRVRDRNSTYWEYAHKPKEYKILRFFANGWQQQYIDLEDDRLWHKFGSDGYYKSSETVPDFSVISGVVLILGGYSSNRQSQISGQGVIDFRKISLSHSVD